MIRSLTVSLIVVIAASAQGLDPQTILHPPKDTWPTYNGDYSGKRFSSLQQINKSNVHTLALA
jgi:glucose dehydrogenase